MVVKFVPASMLQFHGSLLAGETWAEICSAQEGHIYVLFEHRQGGQFAPYIATEEEFEAVKAAASKILEIRVLTQAEHQKVIDESKHREKPRKKKPQVGGVHRI